MSAGKQFGIYPDWSWPFTLTSATRQLPHILFLFLLLPRQFAVPPSTTEYLCDNALFVPDSYLMRTWYVLPALRVPHS